MTSLPSTSYINLNYPLSLQIIIPIKFSVCNLTKNYLKNPRLSCHPIGLTRFVSVYSAIMKQTNLKSLRKKTNSLLHLKEVQPFTKMPTNKD